jgi:NADP-dependent 3-hydroxy acid dehydrogenase YdfG
VRAAAPEGVGVGETWLLLGASSGVARAFARRAAEGGARRLLLAGRDPEDLGRQAADLRVRRGVEAVPLRFDARDLASHAAFARACAERAADGILNVLLAFGTMPPQAEAERDPDVAAALVETNFTGAASVLAALAPALEAQGGGVVVALGSVAGDRGRPRNHLYGATKAALRTYLQGYAARLSRAGVRVLCLQAGPVDTGLTWGLPRLPFMISPEAFADAAWRLAGRGASGEAYVPRVWRPVMATIRRLPTRVFNRLDL